MIKLHIVTLLEKANTKNGKQAQGVDVARQYFNPIPDSVIDALIAKGDVMFCCGGFMIDDRTFMYTRVAKGLFTKLFTLALVQPYLGRREGSEDSIIGMPIDLLARLLRQV